MEKNFIPNFKLRNNNLNKRFRNPALSENGYKNTGRTKVTEWYDWLHQGIVSLLGSGIGTAFLNRYCKQLNFESQWFHLRKKEQQLLLETIIKDSRTPKFKDQFKKELENTYLVSDNVIEELNNRLKTIDELLEHDLTFANLSVKFANDIGPPGISINETMISIINSKKYDPILKIFWQTIPKNRNLNSQEFADLIFKKFNVLINLGGNVLVASLQSDLLDIIHLPMKKLYYNPIELGFIKSYKPLMYKLIDPGNTKDIPEVDSTEYRRIFKRKEVSREEDERLSSYVCGIMQEYTMKTGKCVPIKFWYFPKTLKQNVKEKENVFFLGTSRDKNMNRFVFVFKGAQNLNVVNDGLVLAQILAIDIPLSFLEYSPNSVSGPAQVEINPQELEQVEENIVEKVVKVEKVEKVEPNIEKGEPNDLKYWRKQVMDAYRARQEELKEKGFEMISFPDTLEYTNGIVRPGTIKDLMVGELKMARDKILMDDDEIFIRNRLNSATRK